VLIGREQVLDSLLLCVGEQVRAGVQGPVCTVERVVGAAAVPVEVLLDSAATLVEGVASQTSDVEGIHHRHGVG